MTRSYFKPALVEIHQVHIIFLYRPPSPLCTAMEVVPSNTGKAVTRQPSAHAYLFVMTSDADNKDRLVHSYNTNVACIYWVSGS